MNATILPGPGTRARPQNSRGGDRHNIQSVDRALSLLEALAEAGGEASLTDLAPAPVSMSRPAITCSRRW